MPPRPRPDASASKRTTKGRPQNRRTGGTDRPGRKFNQAAEGRGGRVAKPQSEDSEIDSLDDSEQMRLQKFLATAGVDSRRNCEEYIRTGRVTVDSAVVLDPAHAVDPTTQDIRLDSERLRLPRFRYFLVNKPKGFLCTSRDPQGRPRAIDLVPIRELRMFTVGRLDENTEGLLLVTNDGDLAQKLAHPRFEVVRRYRCHVAGIPQLETLHQLRDGMYFAEGFFKFRSVHIYRRKGQSVILELELQEGKNREIRRLMARVGHKVLALERIAFGPLSLGSLAPGRNRELMPFEIHELRHFAEHGEKPPSRDGKQKQSFGYRSGQTRNGNGRRRPDSSKGGTPQREVASPERTSSERASTGRMSPERTSTERTSPERTSPERTSPERTSPGRTSPERTSPGRTSPGRTSPGRMSPERTSPERTSTGRTSPERKPITPAFSTEVSFDRKPAAKKSAVRRPAAQKSTGAKSASKKAGTKKSTGTASRPYVPSINKGRDRRKKR